MSVTDRWDISLLYFFLAATEWQLGVHQAIELKGQRHSLWHWRSLVGGGDLKVQTTLFLKGFKCSHATCVISTWSLWSLMNKSLSPSFVGKDLFSETALLSLTVWPKQTKEHCYTVQIYFNIKNPPTCAKALMSKITWLLFYFDSQPKIYKYHMPDEKISLSNEAVIALLRVIINLPSVLLALWKLYLCCRGRRTNKSGLPAHIHLFIYVLVACQVRQLMKSFLTCTEESA